MKYTTNLLKGFGTSTHIQAMHYRAALKINDALTTHAALLADRTRTKAEKAPMLQKLQKKLSTEAMRDVDNIMHNIDQRSNQLEQKKADILASMPMTDALALVSAMKGMSPTKMVDACHESRELALAMAIVPSTLSGFNKERAVETLIATHYPDIKTASDELDADYTAFTSLSNNVTETAKAIGFDVDHSALESRFDEKRLDVTPAPQTMADQNAELARLERSSDITPTVTE